MENWTVSLSLKTIGMSPSYWEKFVSRTEDVLHWDSSISMRREPLHIGSVVWGTRNDLALKNGTTLPTWYEHNPVVSEQTNLGEFCQERSLP